MHRAIKYRAIYISALWNRPIFIKWFTCVLCTSVYTLCTFLRDEFATPQQQEHYTIKNMFPTLPISWLIIIVLIAIIGWLFESSFRLAGGMPPLEIIFNPNNPLGRFWSIETPECEFGPHSIPNWKYKVEIKNNSSKTIRNVSLESEFVGQIPDGPFEHIFDKTNKTYCDLKPKCSVFITILRWPARPLPGMLAGAGALAYGPIKVTVSGDDIKPISGKFQFDYQREPMLFDYQEL